MSESQRNLLILVVIAVVGTLFFGGAFSLTTGIMGLILNVAFTIAVAWFLIALYQRHSGTVATMPSTPRTVLQVAGATVLFLLVAGSPMLLMVGLPFPFGMQATAPMIYWPLLLGSAFAIWWAWQQRTSRW